MDDRAEESPTPGAAEPLASVVVVNYNGLRFLEPNLSSLERQTGVNAEVILVDNASSDGSVDFVERRFPDVRIVRCETNTAWTANNLGIEAARGKYVILMNNDTVAEPGLVAELVEAAERDETVGMCAPKILMLGGGGPEAVFDSAGIGVFPDGMSRQRGRLEPDRGQYDRVEPVFVPSGCCALYRKEMLDEVGPIDEDFFAYCEDTDLGLRARLAGWQALYVPSAVVHHHYSGSFGKNISTKAFLVERNHLWVAVKCFPAEMLAALPLFTAYRLAVQAYGVLAGRGMGAKAARDESRFELIRILVAAYASALRGLPRMLAKRRRVQRARRVPRSEVRRWFRDFRVSARDLVLKE